MKTVNSNKWYTIFFVLFCFFVFMAFFSFQFQYNLPEPKVSLMFVLFVAGSLYTLSNVWLQVKAAFVNLLNVVLLVCTAKLQVVHRAGRDRRCRSGCF